MERSAHTIAACLALASYAIAMVAGLAAHNPLLLVMRRGLFVLLGAYAAGLAMGLVVEHVLREHIGAYRAARPTPDLEALELAAGRDGEPG